MGLLAHTPTDAVYVISPVIFTALQGTNQPNKMLYVLYFLCGSKTRAHTQQKQDRPLLQSNTSHRNDELCVIVGGCINDK